MEIPYENEIKLREHAKEVRSLILDQDNIEKALEIIKRHEGILTFNYGKNTYQSLLPTIRFQKNLRNKYKYIEEIINTGFRIYYKSQHYDELVFFAAASCDLNCLHLCMSKISAENRNKTKEGDTILLFFIKYTNMDNSNYLETLRVLVNEYKLDVNKADYYNHSAIITLLNKYVCLLEHRITLYSSTILKAVNIILSQNNVDLLSHKINERNALNIIESFNLKEHLDTLKLNKESETDIIKIKEDNSVLFSLLVQMKEEEFLQCFKENNQHAKIDVEDGTNTLLQLACEKNLSKVVGYLIDHGANLTKTTRRNRKTPLEISARRNHYNIFNALLKTNKIIIDLQLFSTFVFNRGRQMKIKYFDDILLYDGLQVDIAYSNGNTPLHYAIIFSNREAILKLLKRGASLLVKNKNGKDPLDYISKEEMELYLDQCIATDGRNKIYDKKYELRFDFNGLTEGKNKRGGGDSELDVVSKIYNSDRLRPLARHLLITTFVEVKWNLISPFYNKLFLVYVFLFAYSLILTVSSCMHHITYICLMIMFFITFFTTIQPSMMVSKDLRAFVAPLRHIIFTLLTGYLYRSKNIFILLLMLTLFYQFLKQHLHFYKYQSLLVNVLRQNSLYLASLIGLYYLQDFDNFTYLKLVYVVISFVVVYAFFITTNSLADHIGDHKCALVEVNENSLNFNKFSENLYRVFKNMLSNPFLHEHFEVKVKENNFYVHFVLNKNTFSNEKFNFLKLDNSTVKELQEFVAKSSKKD